MVTTEDDLSRGRTRRELIEKAQLECAENRAVCDRYDTHNDDIPRPYLIEFQNSLVDYYWALRPLREQKRVEDHWKNATLSDRWTNPEGEPFTGLDTIKQLNRLTEEVVQERHTVRGVIHDVDEQHRALPYEILTDIYGVLEDAAAELGFTVEPGVTVEEDPAPV